MLKNIPVNFDDNPSINKQIITFVYELFGHTSYMLKYSKLYEGIYKKFNRNAFTIVPSVWYGMYICRVNNHSCKVNWIMVFEKSLRLYNNTNRMLLFAYVSYMIILVNRFIG